MILNTGAVVLTRRGLGEYDRLCSLFTEDLGRVHVRFVGVNRQAGKLKALSEPGAWGEHRLHLSVRSEFAKAVGGRLISSFPGWRSDLERTFDALACCEMLERLTPERSPSPEKYRLICSVLAAFENHPSRWLLVSFGLRLAEMLGISLRQRAPAAARFVWEALHASEPHALKDVAFHEEAAETASRLLDEHFGAHAGRRLRAFEFRDAYVKVGAQGVPAR
ncbi:MAG: DNA repair protein RecO [Elusimicrobiota bacterium]